MKPKQDDRNTELATILDSLLAEDVSITAREVARRHSSLHNASAFTRDRKRMEMIEDAKERQQKLRTTFNPHAQRALTLSESLERRDVRVEELESQLKALVASHAGCIQAVMVSGGMPALERFWKQYKNIGDTLKEVSAFPDAAEVVTLRKGKLL